MLKKYLFYIQYFFLILKLSLLMKLTHPGCFNFFKAIKQGRNGTLPIYILTCIAIELCMPDILTFQLAQVLNHKF